MILAARVFCTTLFLAASFLLLAQPAFAQTAQATQPQSSPFSLDANPDVPQNLRTFTQGVVLESMAALSCILSGTDPTRPDHRCLGTDPVTGKLGFVQSGGALGFTGNMIGILFTPPTHTGEYFQNLAQNFGVAKPAYAQNPQQDPTLRGIGFNQLGPLIIIWRKFLSIVYLLFVVIFVLIGIGIMLRFKIDPQKVMSIENQLPNIIITLLLITFSFAIAGVLIDLMFYSTYLIINVFAQIQDSGINTAKVTNTLYSPPVGFLNELTKNKASAGGVIDLTWNASTSITLIVKNLFMTESFTKFMKDAWPYSQCGGIADLGCYVSSFITGSLATLLSNILGFLATTIVGVLGYLVVLFAILIAMFKLWLQLLRAYVYILLDVILAPFWIMGGLFPGSSVGIGSWLRDMIANLSAFPVAIGMFLVGNTFLNLLGKKDSGSLFVPPLIGNPNLTAQYPIDVNPQGIIGSLAALGIILMTPKVVEMMREVLKAPTFKYTAAIGEALGSSRGYVTGLAGKPIKELTKVDQYGGAQGPLAVWAQGNTNRWMRKFARYGLGATHESDYSTRGIQARDTARAAGTPPARPPQPGGQTGDGTTT